MIKKQDSLAETEVTTKKRFNPFDSVESAYEYIGLLRESVDKAYSEIQDDTDEARQKGAKRRVEALLVVDRKLNQLRQHMLASLIVLNDLRMLRRLLIRDRE